ncbi:MAG: helix-turn-helix transcriptional regulator [Acetivibrio sp.]
MRIRLYRNETGLSQEELAEKCDLHPTYIGQLERGEKNASIITIQKITKGLKIPMELLFKEIDNTEEYNGMIEKLIQIISNFNREEQKALLNVIQGILKFKNSKNT